MSYQSQINDFLDGAPHAVVGASRDRSKIGNRVLQAYIQHDRPAYPINPSTKRLEGLDCFPDLKSVPVPVHGVSIITPPEVAESIVEQAAELGIKHLWFQPGAESDAAIDRAHELGMNVIYGGPCLLVVIGYSEQRTR